jgi:periplasmic protein TonB
MKRLSVFWLILFVGLFALAKDGKKQSTPPKPIYTPDAEYTSSARHDRIEGTVTVSMVVGADGIPHDLKVVNGLRSDLDKKAIEALSKWRFNPARKEGTPIPVSITVEVPFRLH